MSTTEERVPPNEHSTLCGPEGSSQLYRCPDLPCSVQSDVSPTHRNMNRLWVIKFRIIIMVVVLLGGTHLIGGGFLLHRNTINTTQIGTQI